MGCYLKPVNLLKVYFVITSRTIQVLFFRWAEFVQRLISTQSSLLLKYTFNSSFIKSTIFILYPTLRSWCLPLFFLYNSLYPSRLSVSYLGPYGFLLGVWGAPTNATRGHCQRFWYILFVRGGWGYWYGGMGQSPVRRSNHCLVLKSGFPCKELLGDD